jgi:drug/metabolite transporter (DMT)-like permease
MAVAASAVTGVVSPLHGVMLALAAFALFTGMDTSIKLLGGRYHVLQVIFVNSAFGLATVLVIAGLRGGYARLRTTQPRLHALRWLVSLAGGAAFFWCYPRLSLADIYAVIFTAPLLITALSVPLLGEQVGWRRWSAVAVGFAGVLIILDPGHGAVTLPAAVALLGATFHALNMILVRKLGARPEPVEILGLVGNALSLVALAPVMLLVWRTPSLHDLGLSAFAGTIAGSGFLLLAQAFRSAPAALIAPFQYSQMLYGILAGLLVFGDVPQPRMLVGAAIIVLSGLYILRRERRTAGQHT